MSKIDFIYDNVPRRDPNFYELVANALAEEIENESENGDNDSNFGALDDENESPLEASDIEAEYEIEVAEDYSSSESDDDFNTDVSNNFIGKDGTVWSKTVPQSGRIRSHNILRSSGGPTIKSNSPVEVFDAFFTPNISYIIISETNKYGTAKTNEWNLKHLTNLKEWQDLNEAELRGFLGILIAAGVSNNNNQAASVLWKTNQMPIFRATMSYRRFLTISRYIRFNDGRTRSFHSETDKAAPIRDIWNFLNENLQKNFRPYSEITVDEQLFPYRGRTKFTQYIPSKPAKYGIKVWWACDAKTHYPLIGNIYTGKEPNEERAKNQGENELIRLVSKYANSGRTIVADNFFSSFNLCKRLIGLGLSYVGTLRSNKACIPPEMKKHKNRTVLSSEFGFHKDNVAICSYVPKKNKAVILLSTVHYDKEVEGAKQKPAAIMYYNKNKVGVDAMDQMLTRYTTKRKTKRWTLAFFYNIVDVMALGSFVICKENNNYTKLDARRNFLCDLSEMLALPQIECRRNNIHVMKHSACRSGIEAILGESKVCIQELVRRQLYI